MKEKVSIITICHNEAERIESTIKSILGQTYPYIEWIVIDGASTDGTYEILQQYSDRITTLISEPDDGIYAAMNKGIEITSGDYIQFMNGGDRYFDDTVLAKLLSGNGACDLIYGDVGYEDSSSEVIIYPHPDTISLKFLALSAVNQQSILYKRSLFARYGVFDTGYRICADYEFLLRLVSETSIDACYVPLTVACWNMSGISYSRSLQSIKLQEKRDIQHMYLPRRYRLLVVLRDSLVRNKNRFFPLWLQKSLNDLYCYYLRN